VEAWIYKVLDLEVNPNFGAGPVPLHGSLVSWLVHWVLFQRLLRFYLFTMPAIVCRVLGAAAVNRRMPTCPQMLPGGR
jgi:hypothetical protein